MEANTTQAIHLEAIRQLIKHPDMLAYIYLVESLATDDSNSGINPDALKGLIMVDVEDIVLKENLQTVERRAMITDTDFKTALAIAQLNRRK
jgi:hypothetical protein